MTRRKCLLLVLLLVVGFLGYRWWHTRQPTSPTEIFQGITYGCDRMSADDEGSGLVHWVRVDLAAPGIEIYVTPLDPEAVAAGWQFRLRQTGAAVEAEHLAVAMNGALFTSDSGWFRRSGDLARAVETTVADHHVSHVWEHAYLLWFDDALTPALEISKPTAEEVLRRARWGIGGQAVWLRAGKVWHGATRDPDARTAVGIDGPGKLLFMAVFENASPHRALAKLAELGAKDGMLLDGGSSTSMALGANAHGVCPGVLTGGWRPVATHFGVRARTLP